MGDSVGQSNIFRQNNLNPFEKSSQSKDSVGQERAQALSIFNADPSHSLQSGQKNLVIIDHGSADIDLNGDSIPDISHMKSVRDHATTMNPNLNIAEFDTEKYMQLYPDATEEEAIAAELYAVMESAKSGNKTNVVANISVVKQVGIDQLIKNLNIKGLTKENMAQPEFREKIRAQISNYANGGGNLTDEAREQWKHLDIALTAIEQTVNSDIKVVLAAGNKGNLLEGKDGKNSINLYSLALPSQENRNKLKVVGATDGEGRKTDYTAENPLITDYEQGSFPVRPVYGQDRNVVGYDYTGDGKVDVNQNELSDSKYITNWILPGTKGLTEAKDEDYKEFESIINNSPLINEFENLKANTNMPLDLSNDSNGEIPTKFIQSLLNNKLLYSRDRIIDILENSDFPDKDKVIANLRKKSEIKPSLDGTSFSAPRKAALDISG